MSRLSLLQQQIGQVHTVEDLTEVFEGIASMHISKIRDRVVASKEFFSLLWPVYRSLRVDPKERLVRVDRSKKGHNVFLVVTTEGKLASDVVEKIVDAMLEAYKDPDHTDIMVVGSRGVEETRRHGLKIAKSFPTPVSDVSPSIGDILNELYKYDQISVFYQTYESLRTQKVARIDLVSAVRALGEGLAEEGETLTSSEYIFEPGLNEIADYMESVMMGVALIQIIMESKLAGYAARFNAMSRAKHRAQDLTTELWHDFHRARRAVSDERVKEIMKVVKMHEQRRAN